MSKHICLECNKPSGKYRNRCAACRMKDLRKTDKYKQSRKERHSKERLVKTGFTEELYQSLLVAQDYKCAICGRHRSELKSDLCADHNHTTKQTRGLLCHTCNKALGVFQDDISILAAAIAYLERYK